MRLFDPKNIGRMPFNTVSIQFPFLLYLFRFGAAFVHILCTHWMEKKKPYLLPLNSQLIILNWMATGIEAHKLQACAEHWLGWFIPWGILLKAFFTSFICRCFQSPKVFFTYPQLSFDDACNKSIFLSLNIQSMEWIDINDNGIRIHLLWRQFVNHLRYRSHELRRTWWKNPSIFKFAHVMSRD